MVTLSGIAETVLKQRYYLRDESGEVAEDWQKLAQRVAKAISAGSLPYEGAEQAAQDEADIYDAVYNVRLLPNSPALANAGARTKQLAACFVLPVPDDLGGIFEAVKEQALVQKTGGGTGFAFSRLRSAAQLVATTQGKASGPLSFMAQFDAATNAIKQGGMRRGANMGMLRIDHPDILDFISCKQDLSQYTNFNISVAVTEEFMQALEDGGQIELVDPHSGPTGKMLDAASTWALIVKRAHATGEPGLIFLDRMNAENPVPHLGQYEATNPCGEQPLLPHESCNLASVVLDRCMVLEDGAWQIDWQMLRETVRIGTRMLENIVEVNEYVPSVPKIREVSQATRKLGLGVMGFARMLFKLRVSYASQEAADLAALVMAEIDLTSKFESARLARSRGRFAEAASHAAWCEAAFSKREEASSRIAMLADEMVPARYAELRELARITGLRNSNTTTVAPTGTISMIADTTGGCEPAFALAFERRQADNVMHDVDKAFIEALSEYYDEPEISQIVQAVSDNRGSLVEALRVGALGFLSGFGLKHAQKLATHFLTAGDISPEWHIRIQAAFQLFNDSSISKTINFPHEATPEQVDEGYRLAYALGCKGVTVYRDGSRSYQPLSTPAAKEAEQPSEQVQHALEAAMVYQCCDNPQHVHASGCVTCQACGWSACVNA